MENIEDFIPDEFEDDLIPYDESLHSFILRHQLLFHPEIKPVGVITPSGGWRKSVFVPPKAQHIFHAFPDHELLEVIDDGTVVTGVLNQLYDSPIRYVNRAKEVFFHEGTDIKKDSELIRVSFCEHCIEESISKFGYGYFKTTWTYKNNCIKHGVNLRQLPLDGFYKNLKRIKSILKGNISKSFFSKMPVYSTSPSRNIINLDLKGVNTFYPIKVAGCSIDLFLEWIIREDNELSDQIKEHIGISNIINDRILIAHHGRGERAALERMTLMYEFFQGSKPELVRSFVEEHNEIVRINIGPRKQGVLVELVAKKKGLKCNECKFSHCYMKEVDSYDLIDNKKVDLPFIMRNSYTAARIGIQGLIFQSTGDNLWSPLKLCSEFKGDNTYMAVEVEPPMNKMMIRK